MPVQQGKNILAKLAPLQKAFLEVKDKEVSLGRVDLPDGINNGVAQLVDCKLDIVPQGKDGAGNVYFYAAGVVFSPDEVGGVPIKGLRTSITSPIYDTPARSRKTAKDNLDWVVNELKKLGADFAQLKDVKNLELVCASLKKRKPYFRFRTWKGAKATEGKYKDKEPMVNHQWSGFIADFVPGASDESVQDDTQHEEPTDTTETPNEAINTDIDLDALLASANDDDDADQTASQEALRAHAMSLGITEERLDDELQTWEDVVNAINEAGDGSGTDAPADPEPTEVTWTKTDVALYQPIDPKTKKPKIDARKKPVKVECEVIAVYKKDKKVDLKNLDTEAIIKGVPFDALEVPS